MGVFVGRDMERDFVKNYEDLQRKYVNLIDWQVEQVMNHLDELKVEQRELSMNERINLFMRHKKVARFLEKITIKDLEEENIPAKLFTLTYKGEKMEIYE